MSAGSINYKVVDSELIGARPLNDANTVQQHQLGALLTAVDNSNGAFGVGEFQYVKFTGTVVAGDFVVIDEAAFTATQASTAAKKGAIGVAMAAQVNGNFGWVMRRGVHDGANVASGVTAGTVLGVSATAGQAAATSAGNKIEGAIERLVTASAGNIGTVELNWPAWSGNG